MCHVCSIWYMQLTFETARRYRTPLVIAGWTKGQLSRGGGGRYSADAPEYAAMSRATRDFVAELRKDPRYADFPASMEEAVRKGQRRFRVEVQSPHWYLPEATEDHVEIIRRELGWQQPEHSYPAGSTNCVLNFLSSARAIGHFGYTHYHVEMSKLVRRGLITREEALEKLRPAFDEGTLREIAKRCGCASPTPPENSS
jgi:hypothetical protein